MTSRKSTTTFRVVDLEATTDEYRDLVFGMLEESGWDVNREDAAELAAEVLDEAGMFDVGPVLERRGDDIQSR